MTKLKEIVTFQNELFFDGAVQLSWVLKNVELAKNAAEAFVFHGPKYHSSGDSDGEAIDRAYKLKDTVSFINDLLSSILDDNKTNRSNPFWLVVAGYGSGKSHLALTCSELLSNPNINHQTTNNILNKIHNADSSLGKEIEAKLSSLSKPVLILPLDGMSGFHLGSELNKVVIQQLNNHNIDTQAIRDLSPRFTIAENFTSINFEDRLKEFNQALKNQTLEEICKKLQENDEETFEAVDRIYLAANGTNIPIEGHESAQDLIDTLSSDYCGDKNYFSNVVLAFDEFGRYLEYASEKPNIAGDAALQQIFQGIQDNSDKIKFIGFIQYELKAYLKRFSVENQRQLQRYVTRYDTAEKWYLSTNLETIFANMIGKNNLLLNKLWEESNADQVAQQSWDTLSPLLPNFKKFPVWGNPEEFKLKIAKGCWPLHPYSVWFLTRLKDLVQSRSSLTFIKSVLEKVSNDETLINNNIRQVSAAELVLDTEGFLDELVSAEESSGSTTVETLQDLLEKYSDRLSRKENLTLSGVAIIEKSKIGKQSRDTNDKILSEATGLTDAAIDESIRSLSDLGTLEWNDHLGQYELIIDGATKGQFQQWLRKQQAEIGNDAVKDLFIKHGHAYLDVLNNVKTDFGRNQNTSSIEWEFESKLAHTNSVESVINSSFKEWGDATLHKDPKGKIIYLYLHDQDNLRDTEKLINTTFESSLSEAKQAKAPIWIVGLIDRDRNIAEHLTKLYLLQEKMGEADKDKYNRFVIEETNRSKEALKIYAADAIRERNYWMAGFKEQPNTSNARLKATGTAIFEEVYPKAIPFPFDGFSSVSGGGPADAAQLARALMMQQVTGPWVTAQAVRLQNRVNALLVQCWKAFSTTGNLSAPSNSEIKKLYDHIETRHKDDPQRTLLDTYLELIAPPYGLNASSAAILMGFLIGLKNPQRRIVFEGEVKLVNDWAPDVITSKAGKHSFDKTKLNKSSLIFLTGDVVDQWQEFLNKWELEVQIDIKIDLWEQAKQMVQSSPVPESLEAKFQLLEKYSLEAAENLNAFQKKITGWEKGLEKAERTQRVEFAIKIGGAVNKFKTQDMFQEKKFHWPAECITECDSLIGLAKSQIRSEVSSWIPRVSCNSVAQIQEFRKKTEKAVIYLKDLGFTQESALLEAQKDRSVFRVEECQKHQLTIDQCEQYPSQPSSADQSMSVTNLKNQIKLGDGLIKNIQETAGALNENEIGAHIKAIQERKALFEIALKGHTIRLTNLYEKKLLSKEDLMHARAEIDALRELFLDSRDLEEIYEMSKIISRVIADRESWKLVNASVERSEELLESQIQEQVNSLNSFIEAEDMDPVWDITSIYESLKNEAIENTKERSESWLNTRLIDTQQIQQLDLNRCEELLGELSNSPSFLSSAGAKKIKDMCLALETRTSSIKEDKRKEEITIWSKSFLNLANVKKLNINDLKRLLDDLRTAPCEIKPEEQDELEPIKLKLTAQLDKLSVNALFERILNLENEQQEDILCRLTEHLEPVK